MYAMVCTGTNISHVISVVSRYIGTSWEDALVDTKTDTLISLRYYEC